MKRRFPALVATAVLAFACVSTPPDRAPLPEVDEVLDPPAQCSFLIGDPQGVLVQEVIPDSAADGLLLAGDVILAVEGQPTPDSAALLNVLEERSAGDAIAIDYLRETRETTTTLTLGANPDEPNRAMIGVMIRTRYQTIAADEVETGVTPGPMTRPISVGGTIYLFDPLRGEWEQTDVTVSADSNWVATTSGLYSLQDEAVIDLMSEEEISHDRFADWGPIRMIGSIGADLVLVVTQPVPGDPERVAVGVSRFDPGAGETVWVEPLLDGFGIPVFALSSPDQETMVIVGVNEDGSEITGVDLWDGVGANLELQDLASLGTPVGWMDNDTILFRTAVDGAIRLTAATGFSQEVTLDPRVAGLPLFPVGDSRGVMAIEERSLILDDLEDDSEVRVLAQDCAIGRVGEPGWGT